MSNKDRYRKLTADQLFSHFLSQGDEQAIAEIYDRYYEYVRRTLWSKGCLPEIIDDATSDIFIKIQEAFNTAVESNGEKGYQPRGKFVPWLNRIIQNVYWDYVDPKRNRHHPNLYDQLPEDVDEDEAAATYPNQLIQSDDHHMPSHNTLARERIQLVQKALNQMPDDRNTRIWKMRDLDALSLGEIAELEQITVDAAKMAAYYGRANFSQIYKRLNPN